MKETNVTVDRNIKVRGGSYFFCFRRTVDCVIIFSQVDNVPVAQLDRVSDSDSEGCRFESCRVRHQK